MVSPGRILCNRVALAAALLAWVAISAASLAAGTITVNNVGDFVANDASITLREGILIANGQRTPYDNPIVGEPDEVAFINGAVGGGSPDIIFVQSGDFILSSFLPALSDPGDQISGNSTSTIVDGSALSGSQTAGFTLSAGNQQILGLTLQNFPGFGIEVTSANNVVGSTFIQGCRANTGLRLTGSGATNNNINNVVTRNNIGHGLEVVNAANGNLVSSIFSYGNAGHGFLIRGTGTSNNTFTGLVSGITEQLGTNYQGNGLMGILLDQGASNNNIGDPVNTSALSIVVANLQGGIKVDGAQTSNNLIHTVFIGGPAQTNPSSWVGNGTGRGIEIVNGANHNTIGRLGPSSPIVIGGHQNDAIYVGPTGTDNNTFQFIFMGTWNPETGQPIPNQGHGIHIQGGVKHTRIAAPMELAQVEINYCGPGRHGVFLDGNDPNTSLEDVQFGNIHFGNDRQVSGQIAFPGGGNVINITGNVDNVHIGNPGHRNHTNGASGYGIVLDGPNVRNILLDHIYAGEAHGASNANALGGLMIRNGAHDIGVATAGTAGRCFFSGNGGPGITIDATAALPHDVSIRNSFIGMDENNSSRPNTGDGIRIIANAGTSPVVLENIMIGGLTEDDRNIISKNTGNGISIQNAGGVKIYKNFIGADPNGLADQGNMLSGILLDYCETVLIGRNIDTEPHAGNLISGNDRHGIELKNGSRNIIIQNNVIGADESGNFAELHNTLDGVNVDAPGPGAGSYVFIGGENDYLAAGSGLPEIGSGNVISGNWRNGIMLESTSSSEIHRIVINGNHIGTSLGGNIAIPNEKSGIALKGVGVKNVEIGDQDDANRGNLISGNRESGVAISEDASGWTIYRNFIGLNISREQDLGNEQYGVSLNKAGRGEIGRSTTPFVGNVISGNDLAGVRVTGHSSGDVIISANLIGTNGLGTIALGNRDGILVDGQQLVSGNRLTIGGTNNRLTASAVGLEAGNLISGNTRDGIRLASDTVGAMGKLNIRGNVIGLNKAEAAPLGNQGSGIHIVGRGIDDVNIGALDSPQHRNILSGNTLDGVELDDRCANVRLYENFIGCGLKDPDEFPNQRFGVQIHGGANHSHLEKNKIWYNKDNGVQVSDGGTDFNKLTNNSIHRNEKDGIRVLNGANKGIKAPVLDRKFRPGRPTSAIPGRTEVANGAIEVFSDEPFRQKGYWGQGKKRHNTQNADGSGTFVAPMSGANGIITATVTDAQGNTSEFSKWYEATIIQNVETGKDLLAAGKRTAVRIWMDSGTGDYSRRMTGELKIDGGGAIAQQGSYYTLQPFAYFDSRLEDRKSGMDTLVFIVNAPQVGPHSFVATLQNKGEDRAKIDMGSHTFQNMKVPSLAVMPVRSADSNGTKFTGDVTVAADLLQHFLAVYPVNPSLVTQRFRVLGSLNWDVALRGGTEHRKLSETLQAVGDAFGALDATEISFCNGLISDLAGIYKDDGTPLNGFGYGDLTKQTVGLDRFYSGSGAPQGPRTGTFLHEIGHKSPFLLGDTYLNGKPSQLNPITSVASEHDDAGNFMMERFRGYDPTMYIKAGLSGPVFHAAAYVGGVPSVHDFMSNASTRWVDPNEALVIFQGLGGSVAGLPGNSLRGVSESDPLIVKGVIDVTAVTGELKPLRRPAVPFERLITSTLPAEYRVELMDSGNNLLDSEDFAISPVYEIFPRQEDGGDSGEYTNGVSPFRLVLNDDPTATKVVLKKGPTILATLVKSPTAPTIVLVSPVGPSDLPQGLVPVTWVAADVDPGDNPRLAVDIFYTPDGGGTRIPLMTDIVGVTSTEIVTDGLPSGSSPRLIVRVTDGWNESEDMSDIAFARPNQPPFAHISSPLNGDTVSEAVPLSVVGMGYDPEDGALFEENIEWFLDGAAAPFGSGMNSSTPITAGPHTIRLVVHDSQNVTAFHEIQVNVSARPLDADAIARYIVDLADEPPVSDVDENGVVNAADVIRAVDGAP